MEMTPDLVLGRLPQRDTTGYTAYAVTRNSELMMNLQKPKFIPLQEGDSRDINSIIPEYLNGIEILYNITLFQDEVKEKIHSPGEILSIYSFTRRVDDESISRSLIVILTRNFEFTKELDDIEISRLKKGEEREIENPFHYDYVCRFRFPGMEKIVGNYYYKQIISQEKGIVRYKIHQDNIIGKRVFLYWNHRAEKYKNRKDNNKIQSTTNKNDLVRLIHLIVSAIREKYELKNRLCLTCNTVYPRVSDLSNAFNDLYKDLIRLDCLDILLEDNQEYFSKLVGRRNRYINEKYEGTKKAGKNIELLIKEYKKRYNT